MVLASAVVQKVRVLGRIKRQVVAVRGFASGEGHVVKSPVADVVIPEIPMHQYMWRGFAKWHDKIAVECIETNRKYTYEDIRKKATSLAGFLQKMNLKTGDTIAIVLPNVPEYFIALAGAFQAGVTVSTINPAYTSYEIRRQLESSKTKLVITLDHIYPTVKQAVREISYGDNISVLVVKHVQAESSYTGAIDFGEICSKGYEWKEVECSMEDVILLPYSSGTTGLPKGVQLTQRNLAANIEQCSAKEFKQNVDTEATHQDVIPLILPIFHIYGLGIVGLNMFSQGVKFVTTTKLNTQVFAKILQEHSPSLLYVVPPLVLMLLNNPELKISDIKTLRSVLSAAAPLGAADINRFHDKTGGKVDLIQLYGLTETSPIVLHQSSSIKNGIKIGGSGVIIPNTICKLVDANADDGRHIGLGPHQNGELLVKGPQVMKGYYENEEANRNTFTQDGWLQTGDIAYYDEDGHFFITDRLKELIKVKGFQVAPAELEELLRDHPKIKDAAVIGVPDKDSGELPKAFVVPKENSRLTVDDITQFVASKVVKYKHLAGGVSIIDNIPKTASGKILRKDLKKLL